MRRYLKILLCLTVFMMAAVSVHAEENDTLKVDITSYDGQSVLTMGDHPFYTSMPVTLSVAGTESDSFYSISIDDGVTFGTYAKGGTITIFPDDETSPSGRWYVRFRNVSNGKETESKVCKIIFDTTCPVIEPVDTDEISGWITKERNVHFRLSDDMSGIKRIVTKCGKKIIGEILRRDDEVLKEYELEVELKDRGKDNGKIDIECFDLAGNSTAVSYEYMFDQSRPGLSISGAENGRYYGDPQEVHLNATDPDSEVYIDYSIRRQTREEMITTDATNAPADTRIKFDEDGTYTIEAVATDSAGNRSDKEVRRFVIDRTAPVISIEGVAEGIDQRTGAKVSIGVFENNGGSEVNIKLLKTALGKTESIPVEGYRTEADHDIRTVDINYDGDYTLEVTATDRTGNSSSCSKSFRIDQTAPQISLSGLGDGDITSDKPTVRFGVGELFYGSTIMTAVLEKKESSGYVVEKKSDQVMRSASDHMDVVPGGEGEYRLTCMAADRTGNSSTSSISFTVDRTPPVISSLSEVDNGYFRSFTLPKKLSELVKDRLPVNAKAYIDDTPVGDSDVIVEEGKYVLTILAEDDAKNVSEESATFIVDHTAPQIVLSGFDRNGNVKKGSMIDVSLAEECDRLKSVRFNGRNIAIDRENTAHIAVDDYGEYDIEIMADDPAGNVTDTAVHTSCYMYAPLQSGFVRTEKNITSNIGENDKNDVDTKGLAVGLISVLSGTFGLAARGVLRDS